MPYVHVCERVRLAPGVCLHDSSSDEFSHGRDDCVAQPPESLHPSGSPMIHSTNRGFRIPPGTISESCPRLCPGREDPLWSVALGVGNIGRSICSPASRDHEETISSVRGASCSRWYAIPFRIEPALGQVSKNGSEPPPSEGGHVFHQDPSGLKLANEPPEFTPEARLRAREPRAFPGVAEVLARFTGSHRRSDRSG